MSPDDTLLYFITARRLISLKDYRSAFDELVQSHPCSDEQHNLEFERWRTLRSLVALGFCDELSVSRKIAIAPAVLYSAPETSNKFVLTGARAPGSLARIQGEIEGKSINIERIQNHSGLLLPETVILHGSLADITPIAEKLQLQIAHESPAWKLAFAGPSSETVWEQAPIEELATLNWKRRVFDIQKRCFSPQATFDETQDRLVEYFDPYEFDWKCFLTIGDETRLVAKDWSRYIFLAHAGRPALYYADASLYIHATCPLPWWYERCLALCSGLEPSQQTFSNEKFTVFSNVPRKISQLVAKKLGQNIVNARPSEGDSREC